MQKTLITVMAMMARNDAVRQELAVRNYIASPAFKVSTVQKCVHQTDQCRQESVSGKLKVMLLDPRISNYKDGLLERALVSSISELDPASTNLLIYFTATHSPQSKDLQDPSGCSARCIVPSLRCRGQHGVSVSQKPDKKKGPCIPIHKRYI